MPIPCSSKFTATEAQTARAIKSKVSLVLGNYCTAKTDIYGAAITPTATSSGDYSTDYPASGAIDGDRVELNVGPASSAENAIGKSSWRSSTIPDLGQTTYLIVDFATTRTINKLRVYYLTDHALKTYTVQYWDGAAWQDITLSNQSYDALGYGLDAYGTSPYGSPPSSGQGIWGLSNSFGDVTTTKIKITITETEVTNDYANIVEVEAYRVLDISSRVTLWNTDRSRDFKLKQDMASSAELTCDNTDRFFSPDYTPTASQIAAGFVNSELRSQLGVEIQAGFEWSGSQIELIPQFSGFIDKIECNSKSRVATIAARDNMKALLATTVNTRVKTGIPIELAIAYVLNLCNISSYDFEIDLNKSKLTIPYFFVTGKNAKTIIDELVEASGDAQFYFDESGIAIYRQYTTSVPNNLVYYQKTSNVPNMPGWEDYSSIANISLTGITDAVTAQWINVDGWADGNYATNPVWTELNDGTNRLTINVDALNVTSNSPNYSYIYLPLATSTGQWEFVMGSSDTAPSRSVIRLTTEAPVYSTQTGYDDQWNTTTIGTITQNGYSVELGYFYDTGDFRLRLYRHDGNVKTMLGQSAAYDPLHESVGGYFKLTISSTGNIILYKNGTAVVNVTDDTYTAFTHLVTGGKYNVGGYASVFGIYKSPDVFATSNQYDHNAVYDNLDNPTWISQILDLGTDVLTLDYLDATITELSGYRPSLYTRSSDDGLTWDSWVGVNPNSQMGSTARRYLQVKMEYTGFTSNKGILPTPALKDMVINWTRSGSLAKYPSTSSRTISYDGSLLDVTTSATDTLGGDTSILNDVLVVGQPYNLTGTDTDVAWEYLTGIPSEVVSATNPLFVNVGTTTITASISSGMDTSNMFGANPAALNIVYGTAVGTAIIKTPSPINPVIELTITTAGTITGIQLLGKVFSTSVRNFAHESKDSDSITKFGLRSDNVANSWILNNGIAKIIADARLANYKDETRLLDNVSTTIQPSTQIGDRVTCTDRNTGISADYWVVGLKHTCSATEIYSIYRLWKIPAGM